MRFRIHPLAVDLGPHNGFVDGEKPILFISTVFAQSFSQRVIFLKTGAVTGCLSLVTVYRYRN